MVLAMFVAAAKDKLSCYCGYWGSVFKTSFQVTLTELCNWIL